MRPAICRRSESAIRVGDPSRRFESAGVRQPCNAVSAAEEQRRDLHGFWQAMTAPVFRVLSGLYDRVLRAADEQQWARVVEQRQKEQGSSGAGKKADKLWDVVLQVRAA